MNELSALPARGKAPASVNVLRRWIGEAARRIRTDEARIQRRIANYVVLAMLGRVRDERGDPLFLVKGGAMLELRLGLAARASADLDTLFRGRRDDFLHALDGALEGGWRDFSAGRTEAEEIEVPGMVLRPLRVDLKLQYLTRSFATVPLEISAAEGSAGDELEEVCPDSLAFFGLQEPERVPCLSLRYQIAQKLHAATTPSTDAHPNLRVHDVVDLLLLRRLSSEEELPRIRGACVDIFEARALQPWPPILVAHPHWVGPYQRLAEELSVPARSISEAVHAVNEMVERIDASTL